MTASPIDRPASDLISIDVADLGAGVTVTAAGEVDSTSAPALRERLDALLDGGAQEITIDLAAVTFLDSAGLCVLAAAYRRASGQDVRLRVLAASRAVIRPLQITGLWNLLQVEKVGAGAPGADSAA
ncbi:STAS domain-containing protein [Blastococcus jejuensis]|uniref:Anti-sigma factor antagonist n=1 Tax=Blastococcus jejuensis TaxID=351224 RepID=A0ABP6P0U3_9ACTN